MSLSGSSGSLAKGGGGFKAPSKLVKPSVGISKSSTNAAANASGILTENTDHFIVGHRVWVGGTKPGYIQYIGETQFAPGEWAGVVLDEAIGKNDGSVAGVRYFQCEAKRGVFSRLNKLTQEPVLSLMQAEGLELPSDDAASFRANGSVRSSSPRLCSSSRLASATTPRSSTPSSLHSGEGGGISKSLRVGDRVLVTSTSGVKKGTLRYLGTTEFAAGDWAGVQLDEATGKNDGSVEGKRYFECLMKHGLFAPVHKVSKAGTGSGVSATRRSPAAMGSSTTPRRLTTPKRVGSHESISTIGSAASSSIRVATKPRLGVTSLTTTGNPSRTSAASVTATHTAMQGALKEKEQHIQQLIKERDMERAEVVRAAAQVDEAESKLATQRTETQNFKEDSEKKLQVAREKAEASERQLKEIQLLLEEEKKKVEDLQFRVEEESIAKGDLEQATKKSQSSKEVDVEKIRSLEELLKSERSRADRLERESHLNFQGEETLAKQLDEIEGLKEKLRKAEQLVTTLESAKSTECSKSTRVADELVASHARIVELEKTMADARISASEAVSKMSSLESSLAEKENLLSSKEAKVAEQQSRLTELENGLSLALTRAEELQMENSDLGRNVEGLEATVESIRQQKEKLESEVSEHLRSSGDNSSQLLRLRDELGQREKEMESLRQQLQTQKQANRKLEDAQEQTSVRHGREMESLGTKHWQEVSTLQERIKSSVEETERLRKRLEDQALENAAAAESHRTQYCLQLDEARRRAEESGRQMEAVAAQLEESLRVVEDYRKTVQGIERQLERLRTERDVAIEEKNELMSRHDRLSADHSELRNRFQQLDDERLEHTKAIGDRDAKLNDLNGEVSRLKHEFESYRADLQQKLEETCIDQTTMQNMRNHQELQQKKLEELSEQLTNTEVEKSRLLREWTASKRKLEDEISKLEKEVEDSRTSALQSSVNFDNERETLQKMLETTRTLFEQKETELEKTKAGHDTEVQRLRQENARLVLEGHASRLRKEEVATTDSSEKLLEEKEALEGQVDFLNSVIVDMQKKNDELKARVEILEAIDMQNDSSDVNLNPRSAVPPRLFCDICDCFDLHDTEDCPKQEASEDPAPTQYHGSRRQERPYCDICEMFGHWTNECDDNETF